jgi:hypothetical protein
MKDKSVVALAAAMAMSFGMAANFAADVCSHLDTLRMTERVMPGRGQVKPLLDVPLKDPSICKGPDGFYYLTGTEAQDGKDFLNNQCIRIWKSIFLYECVFVL